MSADAQTPEAAMYTQCPACQVFFRITAAQLEARAGLVRCGKCATVFQARERLLDALPARGAAPPAAVAPAEPAADVATSTAESTTSAPPVLLLDLMPPRADGRARVAWALVSALMLFVLTGQVIWWQREALGAQPALRPYVEQYCEWLGCELEPLRDLGRIEFETSMAPHPAYSNALRLRAELINRAVFAQALPRLELTLTDSEGAVLARRVFGPRDYLGSRTPAANMPPNVAHYALLDVTNPDGRAVGYELRLLPSE